MGRSAELLGRQLHLRTDRFRRAGISGTQGSDASIRSVTARAARCCLRCADPLSEGFGVLAKAPSAKCDFHALQEAWICPNASITSFAAAFRGLIMSRSKNCQRPLQ